MGAGGMKVKYEDLQYLEPRQRTTDDRPPRGWWCGVGRLLPREPTSIEFVTMCGAA